MNVLQVLAITSIGFVIFAVIWVTKIEDYLEDRERKRGRFVGEREEGADTEPAGRVDAEREEPNPTEPGGETE